MSDFVENSKHKGLTAMVEGHFNSGSKPDTSKMSTEQSKGYSASNSLPRPTQNYPFNTPNSGVNYTPPSRAGHNLPADDWFNPYK